MLKLAIFLFAIFCYVNSRSFPINAVAIIGGGIMNPGMREPVMAFGDAKFTQRSPRDPVVVHLNVTFMPANSPIVNQIRGVHIHTFGISGGMMDPSQVCNTAGPHWNPTATVHGSVLNPNSHAGDLGNVQTINGRIITTINSSKLQLLGPNSIIGRSIVLHEKIDDQGMGNHQESLKSGNSGSRIACGTIGIVS
uniref:Superoxide dismutase [Cu-Zn] n=1 Tax=Brachionus plicatilis TaxID=10195 RepID=A0A2L0HIK1_BRAPC|nr:copper/zinc superoxide dismutase 2 [Brachionus plicatilis]